MTCKRCSTPMMPIYSPRAGWRYACVKCGAVRSGQPASGNERAGEFAERGLNCFALQDFDEARDNFAQAARLDGDRPAYLWAMLLAQYGVRYCETGKGQYTVNFWKKDLPARMLTAQPEYHKLRRGAAGERAALRYYQQEAAGIDRGMQQVRKTKREPYDVFLCFKDIDEHGPTPERQLCDGLYQELRDRNLKVFYAPRTLYGKYVSDYEGYIHNALRDAKLMVVVASSGKNAASPWVRSEWKRFQRWHQSDDRRLMTCVVGNMTPAKFPKDLQRYQCELYAKEGQLNDRQTLEAIATRIERGCRGGRRRGSNRMAVAVAIVALALAAGGILAWRLLPPRGGSPAPEDAPVEAVITEAPATEVPVTEAPATEVPVTEVPVTEAPTTEVPVTEASATKVPVTKAPATEVPATEIPATEVPATKAPATEVPATEVPATKVPATEAPATEVPVTEAPTATPVPAPPMMRADPYAEETCSVLGSQYKRSSIWSIRFEDSLAGAPGDAWDVSASGDGSVLAWVNLNSEDLYNLTIAGDGGVALPDGQKLFQEYDNLRQIDFNGCVDTSGVADMSHMFRNCANLLSLDLSGFDTSNVTHMNSMFDGCANLLLLNVSGFDTSKVTDMRMMFDGCRSLESLNVSGFDTSNVTRISGMFKGCTKVHSLNVSGFDTSNVTDMGMMFDGCKRLELLDLSNFDTSNVTDMGFMFNDCWKLQSLDLSSFDTSNVTDMAYMFDDCRVLESLDLSGFDTSNVTDMGNMFCACSKLQSLDLSGFDTSNVVDMSFMFEDCKNLTDLRISPGFVIRTGTETMYMLSNCPQNMEIVEGASARTLVPTPPMMRKDSYYEFKGTVLGSQYKRESISSIRFEDSLAGAPGDTWDVSASGDGSVLAWVKPNGELYDLTIAANGKVALTNGYALFCGYDHAVKIDFNGCVDTYKVGDMANMFSGCASLQTLDLSGFNTSNVTSMFQMFSDCGKLQALDLSGFDTSKVTHMNYMFSGCWELQSLDVSSFNTSNVTSMDFMFAGCKSLQSLDVSSFNTSNVGYMNSMFFYCAIPQSLDLTGFDTSNVFDMGYMFAYCSNLTELRISSRFVINVGTDTTDMFHNCPMDMDSATVVPDEALDLTPPTLRADPYAEGADTVLGSAYKRSAILSIRFQDSLEDAYGSAWDVSAAGDGSVLAWADSSLSGWGLYDLTIAGEGMVALSNGFGLFQGYDHLEKIDFSGCVDTSNVEDMRSMFNGCAGLQSLDLSGFDTSNVTDMRSMFAHCENLTDLRLSSTFVINSGTDTSNMFDECPLDMNSVAAAPGASLALTPPTLRADPYAEDADTVLGSGYKRNSILSVRFQDSQAGAPEKTWDVSAAGDGSVLAWAQPNRGGLYDLTIAGNGKVALSDGRALFQYYDHMEAFDFNGCVDTSSVTNMSYMFSDCSNLESLNLSGIDTSNVTDMFEMFQCCMSLESLDLSGFDTSNVTNMSYMFKFCEGLQTLDLSGFDTSNVTDMSYMFSDCSNLQTLDLSGLDTSGVTSMKSMFEYCLNLQTLNLGGIDTSNVTDMNCMFLYCENLQTLDLSGFDTSGVTDMEAMFSRCESLQSLDLSSFDTSKVTYMGYMFGSCKKLIDLRVSSGFVINEDADALGMFEECPLGHDRSLNPLLQS